MTKTLTTEQLQDIYEAAVREEATGNPDESGEEAFDLLYLLDSTGGTGATIRKLIDLVRAANREAQPVGEEEINAALRLHRLKVEGHSQLSDAFRAGFKYARRTAPPAPAVPDFKKLARELVESLVDCGGAEDSSIKQYLKWTEKTCRAAMLAQPVSQGYKLVPVEPTEEMIAAAMNCDDVEFNSDETFCVNFDNIYHAMLAAAPEGGNGA